MPVNRKGRLLVCGMMVISVIFAGDQGRAQVVAEQEIEVDATIEQTIVTGQTKTLDFGTILLSPSGGTFTLDARNNCSPAITGTSTVQDQHCGELTVSSKIPFLITASYPDSIPLEHETDTTKTIVVSKIIDNSEIAQSHNANTTTTFAIGGVLDLKGNELPGKYKGTMKVDLTYQ